MVFSSNTFLFFFLPLFLAIYFLPGSQSARNRVLFFFSLLFYSWGEPVYIVLMLISIYSNWHLGRKIGTSENRATARIWLITALCVNLGLLAFFKYASFFLKLLGSPVFINREFTADILELPLPIGISFYTFQAISYLIDSYRGKICYEKDLLIFGTFISMFPQLIAGPIVRYEEIKEELHRVCTSHQHIICGTRLFIIGLSFKVLLANTFALDADYVFSLDANLVSFGLAWFGAASYTFQIYFDFAGYSLMAIGLGKVMGFTFPINFNRPYIATSITNFWRRWHISLSSWFRDYLYIPLGGNRRGAGRTYFNLFIVFVLCGLWHGAAWNFVIWGCFHGTFLMIEKVFRNPSLKIPRALAHAYTLLVVVISWVIFRSETYNQAAGLLSAMAGMHVAPAYLGAQIFDASYLAMGVAGIWFSIMKTDLDQPPEFGAAIFTNIFYLVMFLACVFHLTAGTHNPFIYYRF